jgi:hypothetical protein
MVDEVAHLVTKELQGLQPCTIVGIFRRPAFAVAGLIAGWMQSAALLRFGNAKRASFMGPSAQHSVSTTNRRRWTG